MGQGGHSKNTSDDSDVVVTDDENHENHEIMRDMSTPKWTPRHPLGLVAGVVMG